MLFRHVKDGHCGSVKGTQERLYLRSVAHDGKLNISKKDSLYNI